MSDYNLVRNRRNFTQYFFNAELTVFNKAVYRLSTSLFIPEIFALKLECCRKLHRFLNVFLPSKILKGAVLPKYVFALTP